MRGDAAHPWARWLAVLGVPSGFLWLLLIHGCGRMTTLWCQYGIKTSCTISCGGRPCQNLDSCRRVIKFSTWGRREMVTSGGASKASIYLWLNLLYLGVEEEHGAEKVDGRVGPSDLRWCRGLHGLEV